MAARRRLPAGFHPQRLDRPANRASVRGLGEAVAALQGEGDVPSMRDALAQREQWRVRDEARRQAQGALPL